MVLFTEVRRDIPNTTHVIRKVIVIVTPRLTGGSIPV
jgi:hypothetical protein